MTPNWVPSEDYDDVPTEEVQISSATDFLTEETQISQSRSFNSLIQQEKTQPRKTFQVIYFLINFLGFWELGLWVTLRPLFFWKNEPFYLASNEETEKNVIFAV